MIKLNLSTERLQKLRKLTKSRGNFNFLGFTLNLKTGTLIDKLSSTQSNYFTEWHLQILKTLLDHYSNAEIIPLTGKLVKFKDVPGGYAYEGAFEKRAIHPIAQFFGERPDEMLKAAEKIGGLKGNVGDASFIIEPLKGILLTYILWKSDEFPASSNILYDESASNYLPTEDLAVLGEVTTSRLIFTRQLKENI